MNKNCGVCAVQPEQSAAAVLKDQLKRMQITEKERGRLEEWFDVKEHLGVR